eukprot:g2635.t1
MKAYSEKLVEEEKSAQEKSSTPSRRSTRRKKSEKSPTPTRRSTRQKKSSIEKEKLPTPRSKRRRKSSQEEDEKEPVRRKSPKMLNRRSKRKKKDDETEEEKKAMKRRKKKEEEKPVRSKRKATVNKKVDKDVKRRKTSRAVKTSKRTMEICFTGVAEDARQTYSKQLKRVFKSDNVKVSKNVTSKTTHLVVYDEKKASSGYKRTLKLLHALSVTPNIVHLSWLDSCLESKRWLPETDFVPRDRDLERKYKFNMSHVLQHRELGKLLENQTVWVTWKKGDEVPPKSELKPLVEAAGGTFSSRKPRNLSDILIVTCESDVKERYSDEFKGLVVYSKEILLTGLLKQDLQLGEKSPHRIKVSGDRRTRRKRTNK